MGGVIALLPLYADAAYIGKAELRAIPLVKSSRLGLGPIQHDIHWASDCPYQVGKRPKREAKHSDDC